MKLVFLILAGTLIQSTLAQTKKSKTSTKLVQPVQKVPLSIATLMTNADCLNYLDAKFCIPENDAGQGPNLNQAWCCPQSDTTSTQCQLPNQCTFVQTETFNGAMQALYTSYTPGLITNFASQCGTSSMKVTPQPEAVTIETNTIAQTCVYQLQVPNKYRNSTQISFFLEQSTNINVYAFKGKERNQSISLIENGDVALVGAPFSTNWTNGMVIVAQVQESNKASQLRLSYQLTNVEQKSPWEQIFLNSPFQNSPYWTIWAVSGAILIVTIALLILFIVLCCKACQKSRRAKVQQLFDVKEEVTPFDMPTQSEIKPWDKSKNNLLVKQNKSQNSVLFVKQNKSPVKQSQVIKSPVKNSQEIQMKNSQSTLDQEVFVMINIFRTQPQQALLYLQERKKEFTDKKEPKIRIKNGQRIVTFEGQVPVDEAIQLFKKLAQFSLPAISLSDQLTQAAQFHTQDTGPQGLFGHDSSDGTSCLNRLKRFMGSQKQSGECISYGCNSALDTVMQLIIDDGVPSRGHRQLLTDRKFDRVGIFSGFHKKWGTMTTIDLCKD